jgi:two-component system, chemotaxis family, chemotaxis protein CheY
MRALVVDDVALNRLILRRFLSRLGFEVTEAFDGADALEKLHDGPAPEVALVDWNMPRMDGLDLVRAVRADPGLASTRLVMVTCETDLTRISVALDAGADEYIMKPFTLDIVESKLQMVGLTRAGNA